MAWPSTCSPRPHVTASILNLVQPRWIRGRMDEPGRHGDCLLVGPEHPALIGQDARVIIHDSNSTKTSTVGAPDDPASPGYNRHLPGRSSARKRIATTCQDRGRACHLMRLGLRLVSDQLELELDDCGGSPESCKGNLQVLSGVAPMRTSLEIDKLDFGNVVLVHRRSRHAAGIYLSKIAAGVAGTCGARRTDPDGVPGALPLGDLR